MTFKKWFDDMEHRYQECYSGYEDLLEEAYKAGAKQERDACWRIACEYTQLLQSHTCLKVADAIRARGEA
jgi:hypothetical protein